MATFEKLTESDANAAIRGYFARAGNRIRGVEFRKMVKERFREAEN